MTQVETIVELHSIANDIWGKPVTFISIHHLSMNYGRLSCQYPENTVSDNFMGQQVRYIGLDQFIKNKRASGRPKDLADIDALGHLISLLPD